MKKGIVPKLTLFFISAVLALVLAEVVLRIANPPQYYLWPPRTSYVIYRGETLQGIQGVSLFSANSLGLRGPELAGEKRKIITIGGSAVECAMLDDEETWPQRLMGKLNESAGAGVFWVGNGGKSGICTVHYLTLLQHLPKALEKLDAVILLCGVNDLDRLVSVPHFNPQDSAFYSEATIHGKAERFPANGLELRARLESEVFAVTPLLGRKEKAGQPQSVLLDACRQFKRRISRLILQEQIRRGELKMAVVEDPYAAWVQNRIRLRESSPKIPLPEEKKRILGAALESYKENLRRIAELCAQRGTRLILVTQPTLWSPVRWSAASEKLLWGGIVDADPLASGSAKGYLTAQELGRLMTQYNRAMMEVGSQLRLDVIDLDSELGSDTKLFYDDCHFNEPGAVRVAEVLSRHLAEIYRNPK